MPSSSSSSSRPPRAHHAFTLVELLVVIGIIALLISILLPTLSRSREQAKSVVCMSNLRSIGQAFHTYLADNKGFGFINYYLINTDNPSDLKARYWFGQLSLFGTTTYDFTDGYLTRYFRNPKVLDCPGLTDEFNGGLTAGTGFNRVAYAANASVISTKVVRYAAIRKPTQTMALIDGATVNSNANHPAGVGSIIAAELSYQPIVKLTPSRTLSNPTFHGRHLSKGNVLWYDGHVTTETPYITTLTNNVPSAIRPNLHSWVRAKLGFLTPYGKSDIPEAELSTRPDGYVNYYYYVNKASKDDFK